MSRNEALRALLARVYDGAREDVRATVKAAEYQRRKDDFVFHMTDWMEDFAELHALMHKPSQFDEDQASQLIIGFLYHVVPHLNAAGRLLLDEIADPFQAASATRRSRQRK